MWPDRTSFHPRINENSIVEREVFKGFSMIRLILNKIEPLDETF